MFVIAAGQDGKTRAHLQPVESGAVLGDEVLILGGLAAGEQVASSGSFKLREGVLVVVARLGQDRRGLDQASPAHGRG